jgi:hypothetical protein
MELPVISLIQTTLAEIDSNFETRQGSAFYDLFVKPQQLMLQPLIDYTYQARYGQSVKLIRSLADPDAFNTDYVDNLVSNFYIDRAEGQLATTTVRVYYTQPIDKQFPAKTAEFLAGTGVSFFNSADVSITATEMSLQNDGNLFYVDIPAIAGAPGTEYNLQPGDINTILNDPDAVRVTNLTASIGGLPTETNTELLDRTRDSIAVRDLETVKGINAILREKFSFIKQIQAIGMGDPEMMRDILYNAHIGGKTDVYIKTPSLSSGSFDVVGLDYDTTREVSRNYHVQMAKSATDVDLPADTGTPMIVQGKTVVREDVVETAASLLSVAIPPGTGIDLTGKEWLRLSIDNLGEVQVKVSGANVAQTQRFEIINSLNAAFGYTVAQPASGNKIKLTSLIEGAGSQITFKVLLSPISGSQYAGQVLFGISAGALPYTETGVAATVYVDGIDYEVNTADGLIYQKTFDVPTRDQFLTGRQTITCGQQMIPLLPTVSTTDGQISLSGGIYYLDSSVTSRFYDLPLAYVRVGDEVTIHSIDGFTTGTVLGTLPQTFLVSEVTSTQRLRLSGFNPTGTTLINSVAYSIKSNQVVVVDYKYNPISVDVGPQVMLPNGYDRGVRPGRADFTITDVPFIRVTAITEIDPDSREKIGEPLSPPAGFGAGGFGAGGFGTGLSGDYNFLVNSPTERFSVFEDSMILFSQASLTKSYVIEYQYVPELKSVHDITRADAERVTGADVLAKNYVPGFVSMTIGIRRDVTNLTTPDNAGLATLVSDLVNNSPANQGLQASDIIKLLEDQGVSSVQTPFTMTCVVLNTDGGTTIVESEDILIFPEVTLGKEETNFVTRRIVHLYPDVIQVVEVP